MDFRISKLALSKAKILIGVLTNFIQRGSWRQQSRDVRYTLKTMRNPWPLARKSRNKKETFKWLKKSIRMRPNKFRWTSRERVNRYI